MQANISLYMYLELEKVRQNHPKNIWIKPFKDLVFQVFFFKKSKVYEIFLVKEDIEGCWTCKNLILKGHKEVLEMLYEISNLQDEELSKFKTKDFALKYSDIDILTEMKKFIKKPQSSNTKVIMKDVIKESKSLLEDSL